MRREGVVLAAIARDAARELIARTLLGAAEHHVLEEMREAREPGRIVHRADLEPQHLRDDRRAVIGDDHDLHAVGQRELGNLWFGCVSRAEHGRKQATKMPRPAIA